jgi:phosphatidate cytidylyltransferase
MVQIHEYGTVFSPLYLFLFFSSTWVNNIFAYLIGSKFGKHKILKEISPNKTWEGFFGGFFGSMTFIYFMEYFFNLFNNYWVLLAIITPIVSLIGDLIQSMYKRRAKIKDSGNLIPGHGGAYDRMDSVIYSALYYYLFLKLI